MSTTITVMILWISSLLTSDFPAVLPYQDTVAVRLRVQLNNGNPAERACAASCWRRRDYLPGSPRSLVDKGEAVLSASERYFAADDGRITIPVGSSESEAFLVLSRDHREGAIAVLNTANTSTEIPLKLRRLHAISLDIDRTESKSVSPPRLVTQIIYCTIRYDNTDNLLFAVNIECSGLDEHIKSLIMLPPGRYTIYLKEIDCPVWSNDFTVSDETDLNSCVKVFLRRPFRSSYIGKTPPEICSTANIGTMGHYQSEKHNKISKLVVFWRYEKPRCNAELGRLIRMLGSSHREWIDHAVIVHCDRRVRTEADYESRVAEPFSREYGVVESLPPMYLDGNLCTIRSWGIGEDELPTAVLLDENGIAVEQGKPWDLLAKVPRGPTSEVP